MAIRVMVVDDHEMVRIGIRCILESTEEFTVVAESSSGNDMLAQLPEVKPDVVLMDIRMNNGEGLSTLGRIKLENPAQAVVIFSAFDNPTFIARAVALGASGYLTKEVSREKLQDVLRAASKGGSAFTREELRRVSGALATPRLANDIDVPLTQRESEVLGQMSLGLTNKEIAKALDISYETVKEHVQHILRKIGVTDRTQAAVWAVRKGIV
jgi:DNA-binding NarL/FixJ family response regulator